MWHLIKQYCVNEFEANVVQPKPGLFFLLRQKDLDQQLAWFCYKQWLHLKIQCEYQLWDKLCSIINLWLNLIGLSTNFNGFMHCQCLLVMKLSIFFMYLIFKKDNEYISWSKYWWTAIIWSSTIYHAQFCKKNSSLCFCFPEYCSITI